jgi:hypothetical protein
MFCPGLLPKLSDVILYLSQVYPASPDSKDFKQGSLETSNVLSANLSFKALPQKQLGVLIFICLEFHSHHQHR